MAKYFENRITGEIMKLVNGDFEKGAFNPFQWDEISEERYNELLSLKEENTDDGKAK